MVLWQLLFNIRRFLNFILRLVNVLMELRVSLHGSKPFGHVINIVEAIRAEAPLVQEMLALRTVLEVDRFHGLGITDGNQRHL